MWIDRGRERDCFHWLLSIDVEYVCVRVSACVKMKLGSESVIFMRKLISNFDTQLHTVTHAN